VRGVIRRLHRLEERLTPQPNPAFEREAQIARERLRRWREATGQPFEDYMPPREAMPAGPVRYLSEAETARLCLQQRVERRRAHEADALAKSSRQDE
jgi:hypothetical protein